MKNAVKAVIIGAALMGGMLQTHAVITPKTNWVQTVDVRLEVWQAGQARPGAITTRSIITALGGSNTSKLLVKESGTNTVFLLRTGTTDTDVTSHFVVDRTTSYSSTTGALTTRHSLNTIHFDSPSLKFDASGVATETRGAVVRNGPVVTKSFNAKVAGDGRVGTGATNNAIVDGTIATIGGHLE